MPYRKFLWVSTPIAACVWLLSGCGAPLGTAASSGEVSPEISFVNKGSVTGFSDKKTQPAPSDKAPTTQDFSTYYRDEDVVFDIEPTIQKGKIFMRKTQEAAVPREVITETARLKQEMGQLKNQFAQTQDAYARERASTLNTFNNKVQMLSEAHERERQNLVGEISGLKSSLRQVEATKHVLKGEIVALAKKQELDKRIAEERRQAAKDARAESFMEELEIRKKLDDIRRQELLQTAEMHKRTALESERRLTMLESERKGLVAKISDLEGELTQFAREDDVLQTSKSFETMVSNLSKQLDILGADAVRRSEFALSDTWTRDALNRLSGTLEGLQHVSARKEDIVQQNKAIEGRLLAMQGHIEGVKAFADQNRELTNEQRKVIGRVADLSKGIDAIQYQLDSQNSISAAAQASLQTQLASLNDEFTELRKVSASKGDVGATRALVEARARHLSESMALLQSQVQSGQELDMKAQRALDKQIHEVGIEITALNADVDYMKDGLEGGLNETRALRDSIQGQLASLNNEFTALRKVSATKDDVHMTRELFDVRVAYLDKNIERLRDLFESGQFKSEQERELMSQNVRDLGLEILTLNSTMGYMQDGLNAGLKQTAALKDLLKSDQALRQSEREKTRQDMELVGSRVGALTDTVDHMQDRIAEGLGQSQALRDSMHNQLASLNNEFTELRRVSATKGDVEMTRELVGMRVADLSNNIDVLRDQLDSGYVESVNARQVVAETLSVLEGEILALNGAVQYMQGSVKDGISESRSLRDSMQKQLIDLNNEFTELRRVAASKDALNATNTLVANASEGLSRELKLVHEQMANDRLRDFDSRQAISREMARVAVDIQSLRNHFDHMQSQDDVRFSNYVDSQAGLQKRLDGFMDELNNLQAVTAQKSDMEGTKALIEERLASLQADVSAVKSDMASKVDLDTLKADLEEKIFSMQNAKGIALNSGDFIESHARFDAVQSGEDINSKNLQVAILQPPSVHGDVKSDIHVTKMPTGYVAAAPMENWIDLQDYQVVVHAENKTLEKILGDVLHAATPFTGEWTLKWKLKDINEDILTEKFSLNAETSFDDFANYISSYMFNYRGFKLSFNLFDKERIVLVTDSE